MVRLLKILPVLVMLAGLGVVISRAGRFLEVVTDKAKVLVTGMELARIGEEMRFHYLRTGSLPGLGGEDDFERFVRDSFRPYWGGRDPADDLWGERFVLETGGEESESRILSRGPNRGRDDCRLLDGRTGSAGGGEGTGSGSSAPGEEGVTPADDICVSMSAALRDS